MTLRRFSLFFILIVLWDSIDDQCVAFAQKASQPGRLSPTNTDDDDDYIPFAFIYRAQIIANIQSARFTPVSLETAAAVPAVPAPDLLYLLMSLQL
jgi:hypothetical protein